jgi:parallel beta-helix repeat protein
MKKLWLLAFASLLLPLALPVPAGATALSCGDVVTTDIVLTHDLVDCPDHGLVVGASGITIDLNGYTIDGNDPSDVWGGAGVYIPAHHERVVVRKGTITQFSYGVHLDGSSRNIIRRLRLFDNVQGVEISNGALHNRLKRLHFDRDKNAGLRIHDSDENVVRFSRFDQSESGFWAIVITNGADKNRVMWNRINGSSDRRGGAIEIAGSDYNTIRGSRISQRFWGISLASGTGNVVDRNRVTDGGYGIFINATEVDAVVARNRTNSHTRDGIHVAAGAVNTTLAKNRASNNGGWGIIALAPVVDGGKNRARGNGQPDQCLGITCRR